MLLINGQRQTLLNVQDRATQFGDGCFTTARILRGELQFSADHIARLQQGCRALLIDNVDWHALQQEIAVLCAQHDSGVLKAVISRGVGGRGYSPDGTVAATRILSVSPYPQHYVQWRERGIHLVTSPIQLGKNPALAGIKHLNRLEQVLIRAHLDPTSGDEALVCDSDGMLVECCAANLFWRKDRQVFTPELRYAGVDGTMRQRILRLLAQYGWDCQQVREPLSSLADASEVLVCNALMPIIPVNQAHTWRYHSRTLYDFLISHCE